MKIAALKLEKKSETRISSFYIYSVAAPANHPNRTLTGFTSIERFFEAVHKGES